MRETATEREQIRAVIDGVCAAIGAQNADAVRHYASHVVQFSLAPPLRTRGPTANELAECSTPGAARSGSRAGIS